MSPFDIGMITSDERDTYDRFASNDKHLMGKILTQRVGYPVKRAAWRGKHCAPKRKCYIYHATTISCLRIRMDCHGVDRRFSHFKL
ncbi:IS1 family transposase [Klebsiella pneumoniae]|uniref:IS1 family transposase n=2 Tax=Klebsiella pneumoniae TaxID=573 RepID=UPI001D0DEF40